MSDLEERLQRMEKSLSKIEAFVDRQNAWLDALQTRLDKAHVFRQDECDLLSLLEACILRVPERRSVTMQCSKK